ncbi:MAG: phosphatidate cytidylyltransferase [Candidatus Eisenbacteria bacterium]|nr:phosphatidate cytidylyltransferase [Candidatus Eisenbacteria bacterium]
MFFFSELKRKSIHFASLVIPLWYYYAPTETVARRVLLVVTLIVLLVDTVRLNQPRVRNFFRYFLGELIRDHEDISLLGSTYLLLATLLTVHLFPKAPAVACVSFLIVGDTMAALFGKAFGRTRVFGKTVEGSAACFVSCLIVGWIVPGLTPAQIFAGSLVGTIFELLPIPLDDNFRIPLSAGFAMSLVG